MPLGRWVMRTSKKERELSFSISIVNFIWGEMLLRWLKKEVREGCP
jgi:hypothetical protein